MFLKRLLIATFTLFLLNPVAYPAEYDIDPTHSSVSFKVRHLLTWTQGTFNEFTGTLVYEPGTPELWQAGATIQAASIDTNNQKRDDHLRSADFFEVETYPTLTFTSTGISDATETGAKLSGLLNLHGVEKPVVLDLEIHGVGDDPWGNVRAGFTATTTIDRRDFGIDWSKALGTGRLVVGNEVRITLEIEAIQKKG
jgi:polyisoprenoid-binding protein YceI